jgi:hypothetical protein
MRASCDCLASARSVRRAGSASCAWSVGGGVGRAALGSGAGVGAGGVEAAADGGGASAAADGGGTAGADDAAAGACGGVAPAAGAGGVEAAADGGGVALAADGGETGAAGATFAGASAGAACAPRGFFGAALFYAPAGVDCACTGNATHGVSHATMSQPNQREAMCRLVVGFAASVKGRGAAQSVRRRRRAAATRCGEKGVRGAGSLEQRGTPDIDSRQVQT